MRYKLTSYDLLCQMLKAIPEGDSCMEWPRGRANDGYGMVHLKGIRRNFGVHRIAYELAIGLIPPGMNVCHKCDNRPCFRPDHMFLGSALDNAQDRTVKGRSRRGFRAAYAFDAPFDGEFHDSLSGHKLLLHLLKNIPDGNACLDWPRARNSYGYGLLHGGQKIHRLAWTITHGPIPSGLLVCHSCDRPICFRPSHLWLGTNLDNQRDRHSKGRYGSVHGAKNPNAKLTEEQVREIRSLHASGVATRLIAERFSITLEHVWHIYSRATWRNI